MRRVLFYRLYDVVPTRLAELEDEARAFTRSRAWRGDAFWLATENTTDLFAMEYFRHLRNEEGPALSAAGFLRLLGDEAGAIATLYFLNDTSQRFPARGRATGRGHTNCQPPSHRDPPGRAAVGHADRGCARRATGDQEDGGRADYVLPSYLPPQLILPPRQARDVGLQPQRHPGFRHFVS